MKVDTKIKVRYAETDAMGVVYHANYPLYFEEGRTAFLERVGFPYADMEAAGYMSPVVDMYVKYGSPLKYGDTAIVRTYVIENRPVKTVYAYEVYKEGMDLEADEPLVIGRSTHCVVGRADFKPVSLKRAMPELYARYQQVLESE